MPNFFIVDFDEPGVVATGKGPRNILVRLAQILTKKGIASEILPFEALLQKGPAEDENSYVLLHYNEVFVVRENKVDWLQQREAELTALGYKLLHSVQQGAIIGDKIRQNECLTAAGVPMPRLLRSGDDFQTAFSNEVSNAHVPVHLIEPGQALDETRYNTEYVDCRHEYNGALWNVCIRAQAIGKRVLFSWVRAGAEESVHSRDTPVDAGLIQHFHRSLVLPNADRIQAIADGVNKGLGPGFYAHDILPCARTGRLFLCETNWKFYDGNHRFHMSPIASEHPVPDLFDGRKVGRKMARALVAELGLTA